MKYDRTSCTLAATGIGLALLSIVVGAIWSNGSQVVDTATTVGFIAGWVLFLLGWCLFLWSWHLELRDRARR